MALARPGISNSTTDFHSLFQISIHYSILLWISNSASSASDFKFFPQLPFLLPIYTLLLISGFQFCVRFPVLSPKSKPAFDLLYWFRFRVLNLTSGFASNFLLCFRFPVLHPISNFTGFRFYFWFPVLHLVSDPAPDFLKCLRFPALSPISISASSFRFWLRFHPPPIQCPILPPISSSTSGFHFIWNFQFRLQSKIRHSIFLFYFRFPILAQISGFASDLRFCLRSPVLSSISNSTTVFLIHFNFLPPISISVLTYNSDLDLQFSYEKSSLTLTEFVSVKNK